MKKTIAIVSCLMLITSSASFAKAQMGNSPLIKAISPAVANRVQNAQQLQNQGEEQNLQIENRLEEGVGVTDDALGGQQDLKNEKKPASKSAKIFFEEGSQLVKQKSNDVALKVRKLLLNRDFKGGIGEEVRLIAQNQIKAQEKIVGELTELEDRPGWQRFFFGNKQSSIDGIESVLLENETRIDELVVLLEDETLSIADSTALEESILELKAQQESLEAHLSNAGEEFSLFGFFKNLFKRN